MKKRILTIILAFGLIFSACGNKQAAKDKDSSKETSEDKEGKVTLYTSVYSLEQFVKYIGGDKVDVKSVVPNNANAHTWEPDAKDLVNMAKADGVLINGAGFESWLDSVKKSSGDIKFFDMSQGIKLLEAEADDDHDHDHNHKKGKEEDHGHDHQNSKEEDHDHGEKDHHHGKYDPHIWLSLDNAKIELENIYRVLTKVDPKNESFYKSNLDKYTKLFDETLKEYKAKFKPYSERAIVVPHEAFAYLCRDFGIEQIGIEGINSDSEPNSGRLKEIIDEMKEHKVKTVFYEFKGSDAVAKTIAAETNAKIDTINTLEANSENEDYLTTYKSNLDKILESFK